jgi:hypothetical protein
MENRAGEPMPAAANTRSSRLVRGARGEHRTLEATEEPRTSSFLLCKHDRRRRPQRNYLRYKTNVIGVTIREGKESE